jgi:hypothetical protein
MDALIQKTAEQVPNLAVLSFIVFLFLRFLRQQNDISGARDKEQATLMADLNLVVRSVNKSYERVLEANTIAAARNTLALDNASKHIEAFAAVCNKCGGVKNVQSSL